MPKAIHSRPDACSAPHSIARNTFEVELSISRGPHSAVPTAPARKGPLLVPPNRSAAGQPNSPRQLLSLLDAVESNRARATWEAARTIHSEQAHG